MYDAQNGTASGKRLSGTPPLMCKKCETVRPSKYEGHGSLQQSQSANEEALLTSLILGHQRLTGGGCWI